MRRAALVFCVLITAMAAGPAFAGCEGPPPLVRVEVAQSPVRFDTSRPASALDKMTLNAPASYPAGVHSSVGGITGSRISFGHAERFDANGGCIRLREILVTLRSDPVVYIASDLHKSACRFEQIFRHESLHVEADRTIMAKYRERFADGLRLLFAGPGDYVFSAGTPAEVGRKKEDAAAGIEAALAALFDAMMVEYAEEQDVIDSPQALSRMNYACQDLSF